MNPDDQKHKDVNDVKTMDIESIPPANDLLNDKTASSQLLIHYIYIYQQKIKELQQENELLLKQMSEINEPTQDVVSVCFSTPDQQQTNSSHIKQSLGAGCVCGASLQSLPINKTYIDHDTSRVQCDECDAFIEKDDIVFHCPLECVLCHPLGYDICTHCADKPKHDEEEEKISDFKSNYLTLYEAQMLNKNDKIDYRDKCGKFKMVTIVKKIGANLKVRFDDDSSEPDIWVSFPNDLHNFAKPASMSKRKGHRFKKLKMGGYIDVNPKTKHPGWKCGKIARVSYESFTVQSQQIWVTYKLDDEEYGIWTHIDNTEEVAEFGTKSDPITTLKCNYYEAFLGTLQDKHSDDIMDKLKICCDIIKRDIITEKWSNKSWLMPYLYNLRHTLYENIICVQLKDHGDQNMMVEIFENMHSSILQQLRLQRDKIHLELTDDILRFPDNKSNKIDLLTKKIRNEYIDNALHQIKIKWFTLSQIHNDDDHDVHDCSSVQRIEYLLELFNVHFINKYKEHCPLDSENNMNDNELYDLGFMDIFNQCINDKNQYPVEQLLNDINHMKEKHMKEILNTTNHVIQICRNNPCIIKTRESQYQKANNFTYFGYDTMYDINIIKIFVNIHIYFLHKQILNPSAHFDRIDGNKTNKTNKYSKFATEIIDDDNYYTNSENNKEKVFQFGIRFYYTDYFKNKYQDKYIDKPYFNNLKEELLNNQIYSISLKVFHTELINAANHFRTKKVKKLKANNYGNENNVYQCPVDAPITISHLLCVLLYTNMTELQYKFKKFGCRQLKQDKIIEVAKRNSYIGNWYQFFTECVFFYGDMASPDQVFYHGLNTKLLFTSFNPKFECPISTTTAFLIAQKFGEAGIVLKLMPKISGDIYLSVSWLSDYPKEQECIFVSTNHLFIHDILYQDVDSKWNISHSPDLAAIRLFDSIFNSNVSFPKPITKESTQKLLIKYLKNDTFMDRIHEYMNNNLLQVAREFIAENGEEYDSEALMDDLEDWNHSNIKTCILSEPQQRFKQFCEALYNDTDIPRYLKQLFCFMLNKVMNKTKYSIKSEYMKLTQELRNTLNKLEICKLQFIHEFTWQLNGENMSKLKQLKIGKMMSGQEYRFYVDEDKYIIFVPKLRRFSTSFPDHCSFWMLIRSVPSNITSDLLLKWSVDIKEVDYSSSAESFVLLKKGQYYGIKTFQHNKLDNIDSLTIKIFVRLQI